MKDRRISAYFATRDHAGQALELADVIASYLGFAFEVVVCDAGSSDGTWEELVQLACTEPRLRLLRFTDGAEDDELFGPLSLARESCRGAFAFQGSPTLIVEDEDAAAFDGLLDRLTASHPVLALPVLRFRGGVEHVRRDVPLSRPCLSRNDPTLGLGRARDTYIDRVSGEGAACLETIPASLDAMRHDGTTAKDFVHAFAQATRDLPVLWCHAYVRDVLPVHRVPRDLVPTPARRDRVLRPRPRHTPATIEV